MCVYNEELFSLESLKPHFLSMLVVSDGTVYICMNHLGLERHPESNILSLLPLFPSILGLFLAPEILLFRFDVYSKGYWTYSVHSRLIFDNQRLWPLKN